MDLKNIYTAMDTASNHEAIELRLKKLEIDQNVLIHLSTQSPSNKKRRSAVKLLGKANLGLAILHHDGITKKFAAYSSIDTWNGWNDYPFIIDSLSGWIKCTKPSKKRFETLVYSKGLFGIDDVDLEIINGPYDRIVDSEAKVLHEVSDYLDQLDGGKRINCTLFLYTDRKPCCSCNGLIRQFEVEYNHVDIVTLFGGEMNADQ